MLRVGITGGMGSGKSTISRMFELLGIPVYYADDEAKKLMNEDELLRSQVINLFGKEAYVDKTLNRSFISAQVFTDSKKIEALNALVHPAVKTHGEQWMQKQNAPYTLKEAALIFESGSHLQLDFVIGVWCPIELRIERVMKRDGLEKEAIMARMEKQMDEDDKMKRCDFVITNDEKTAIIPQVLKLHAHLLNKA